MSYCYLFTRDAHGVVENAAAVGVFEFDVQELDNTDARFV